MTIKRQGPLLLTPGPLTTSASVKEAMLRDWGSRDEDFLRLTRHVRETLVNLGGGDGTHVAVLLQGSGTFALEAMLGTLVARPGKVLVAVNGAYGARMAHICRRIGREVTTYETPEDTPPDPGEIERRLAADQTITHVAVVHCETTCGILNPVAEVAAAVAAQGRQLLIDAMSSFGALPFDAGRIAFEAMASSANKCLQGVPGLAFVLCRESALHQSAGNAPSLSLDLYDQWQAMEMNGQWRFTPPTHVVAALSRALEELASEGGIEGRHRRYQRNCEVLIHGMKGLGFRPILPARWQAPIIVTFAMPGHSGFDFERFYRGLKVKGYVIYPGKLTRTNTFRIGCIGDLDETDIERALEGIRETLEEMHVDLTLADGAEARATTDTT
ncbi:MAG: 2-aminoethylphosphonate--pyruvate transaminase [Gammaproteobacteria bacterium]